MELMLLFSALLLLLLLLLLDVAAAADVCPLGGDVGCRDEEERVMRSSSAEASVRKVALTAKQREEKCSWLLE